MVYKLSDPMGKYVLILILCAPTCMNAINVQVPGDENRAQIYLERARELYDRAEYDSVPYYYRYSEAAFNREGKYELSAECMLGMVDCYRKMNMPRSASLKLDSAERYIESRLGRDSESWSDAIYTRAKLEYFQNRNDTAISLLNTWLERERGRGANTVKQAWVHEALGMVYYSLGEMDSSEVYYKLALSRYREFSSGPTPDMGRLMYNLGLVYSQRNNRRQWGEYTREGIENDIRLFGPDSPELAKFYSSMASYSIAVGRIDSAKSYLELAESMMKESFGEDYFGLSRIYFNRARIAYYEGDYRTSLQYYTHSLEIQQAQEVPRRSLLNTTYANMGNLYSAMEDYQTAKDYYGRLMKMQGKVHPSRMALYYSHLAETEINLGNYGSAEKYMKKIMAVRDAYPSLGRYHLAFDYETYGILMDSTGQHGRAGEYFGKALELARINYGDHDYRTALIYETLGDHCLRIKDPETALGYYQQSLECIIPGYDTGRPDLNPAPDATRKPMFYLSIMKKKGSALESLARGSASPGQLELYTRSAFSAYRSAVEVTDLLSTSYPDDESKLYRTASERYIYEKGVRYAYRNFQLTGDRQYLTEAFRIAERGKYATLQSVLRREDALHLAGIPDSLRLLEETLKKRIRVYQAMITENLQSSIPDTAAIQQFRNELFEVKDRITGLHRKLEKEFPDYYSLVYGERIPDPEEFAGGLRRSQKIIEYFLAGNELYTFELSRRDFTCSRDSLDAEFRDDLDRMERYLGGNTAMDTVRDQHFEFIHAAHRLYNRLVPSADKHRDLIFIPEGELSFLPFDILVTRPVKDFTGSFKNLPFLIRSHTIRYGYSSSLLARKDRGHPESLRQFAGFAPGYMARSDTLAGSNPPRDIRIDRSRLQALPGSIEEVKQIGKLFRGRVFTGMSASEGKFKEQAVHSHILHLAAHTFIDDEDPLRSKIVFSDNREDGEDGLLNVYELYNMEMKARLVVLSACNTGAGKMIGGEGIISLSRAFFYAGVPNVLLTLWTVTDQQSFRLMLAFYHNLKRGRSAERSLQKAKLEFLDTAAPQYQHPRYWAGFILAGNPEPLFTPFWLRWGYILGSMVLLSAAAYILFRKFWKA